MPRKCNIGNIYAITSGDYMGEFFVLMEQTNESNIFLSLPDFHIRHVPKEKYEVGIENKILDFQEVLPKDVFTECLNKYNEIKNGNQ